MTSSIQIVNYSDCYYSDCLSEPFDHLSVDWWWIIIDITATLSDNSNEMEEILDDPAAKETGDGTRAASIDSIPTALSDESSLSAENSPPDLMHSGSAQRESIVPPLFDSSYPLALPLQ